MAKGVLLNAAITAVTTIIANETPNIIGKASDYINTVTSERKYFVRVPKLYSKDIQLTINEAEHNLEKINLQSIRTRVTKNIEYRNCIDGQVVASNPKSGKKIPKGTTVELFYITSDVIEESKNEYNINEKQKKIENAMKNKEDAEKHANKIKYAAEKAENEAKKANEKAILAQEKAKKLRNEANEAANNLDKANKAVEETQNVQIDI